MTKQLFIIYDKDYKVCAELLYNLLSQHSNIKASMYTQKEIKGTLVSREKCLYIGTGCSSNLKFEDLYDELGIHVGYMGAKAWIRCFSRKWNKSELEKFRTIFESYSKQYKTIVSQDIDLLADFVFGIEPWSGNRWKLLKKYVGFGEDNPVKAGLLAFMIIYLWPIVQIFKLFGDQPDIRTYQYYVGVFTFYEKYLKDFLEISALDDTDIKQEETLENEKKKKE